MKINFIRHAESYGNIIKKYNKDDYNKRKIINYDTFENEKIKNIEDRLFDTFLTEKGIESCIKKKNCNNKNISSSYSQHTSPIYTEFTIIISPLKRVLITTFFLYYDNFVDSKTNIKIFISNNFKEIFYYPNDLLENYNDELDNQINDIKINIINKMKNKFYDIENKFNIYVNILKKNLLDNYRECYILNYYNKEYNILDKNIKIDDNIKKKFYLENLKEFIKLNNITTDIDIITHWGVISSIFSITNIDNLDKFNLDLLNLEN